MNNDNNNCGEDGSNSNHINIMGVMPANNSLGRKIIQLIVEVIITTRRHRFAILGFGAYGRANRHNSSDTLMFVILMVSIISYIRGKYIYLVNTFAIHF